MTDAVQSGDNGPICYFNDPEEEWNDAKRGTGPSVDFADERVRLADLSGDGLQDIAVVYDGDLEYWPSLGHGNWGPKVRMRNAPRFPYGYDPRRILLGDVDGDGLADCVYVDDERVLLWLNQSGERWSDRIAIDGTPGVGDMDAIRLVDLLGTGVPGILYSADRLGTRNRAFFLDFTGGVKPYLLDEIDNNMGATTRVGYEPSIRFYLEDQKRPETRWQTPLPFPVHVVSRVEAIDVFSEGKLTTEYRYHHGYWDGVEREFRGFGMVEQFDTERFEAYNQPGLHGEVVEFTRVGVIADGGEAAISGVQFSEPTVTKHWFHQGAVSDPAGGWTESDYKHEYWAGDEQALSRPDSMLEAIDGSADRRDALRALRGRTLRTELYALDGSEREDRPYTVTEQLHGVTEVSIENDNPDRKPIFFAYSLGQRTTQWERGDDPMTQFTFTAEFVESDAEVGGYDRYGLPRWQMSVAVPRGADYREPLPEDTDLYLGTATVTEYARDGNAEREDVYIVDRAASATTYDISGRADSVFALRDVVERHVQSRALDPSRIVAHSVNFYDGDSGATGGRPRDAFTGLPCGEIDQYGVPVRTETLVLTDEIVREVYDDGTVFPPSLQVTGTPDWSEYPDKYRELLPGQGTEDATRPGLHVVPAGYGYADGEESGFERGYYTSERRRYDFQLPNGVSERAYGHVIEQCAPTAFFGTGSLSIEEWESLTARITHDETYALLPVAVRDPVGLTTTATYDFRTFQPRQVTDPNGNRTAVSYNPLGLPMGIVVMGKEGEPVGDTFEQPGTRFEYDLLAFEETPPDEPQPVAVHTIKREEHEQARLGRIREENERRIDAGEPPLTDREIDEEFPQTTIESREYSDGFGRLLQTRTQAEEVIFGDETFGTLDLLIEQAVLVPRSTTDINDLEDLSHRRVVVPEGTLSEEFARTKLSNVSIETTSNYVQAVNQVLSSVADAAILDEPVARAFEATTRGEIAFATGRGELRGVHSDNRVTVSGWQTYDNKGQTVEKYEPFFAEGWEYLPRTEAPPEVFGVKTTVEYDPRGQAVRTINPDGSEQRVIIGEPSELSIPNRLNATPWKSYTYDSNDNAGRTHPDESSEYESHWNTPASVLVDSLGRQVEATVRNVRRGNLEEYTTSSTYDIRGNLLTVTVTEEFIEREPPSTGFEERRREEFWYSYDLANSALRTENVDAGMRRSVFDSAGNEVERRDEKGALLLQGYDALHRPTHMWARDGDIPDEPVSLREYIQYGNGSEIGLSTSEVRDANLLGRIYRHYDEAGRLTLDAYDFKGNVEEKVRQVFADEVLISVFDGSSHPFRVDWHPPSGSTLEDHARTLLNESSYRVSTVYDALNRGKEIRYPEDVGKRDSNGVLIVLPERKGLHLEYNRGGALEQVELVSPEGVETEGTYVERIAYNAKGQRTLIAYGNDIVTRYAYDPRTFRLTRLRTESFTMSGSTDVGYDPTGTPLQDFSYAYDLAGNITAIRDRTPTSGIPDTRLGRDALDRTFTYDPLYRLTSATGRECDQPHSPDPWDGSPRCNDPTLVRSYTRSYEYDPLGNMEELRHRAMNGNFTRSFPLDPGTNQLNALEIGNGTTRRIEYNYDDNGNLTQEAASRHFEWDHSDRMKAFYGQIRGSDPAKHAHYFYDAGGERVLKLVRNRSGQFDVRVYIDGIFEHYRWNQSGSNTGENNQLHIADDQQRIALVRQGSDEAGENIPEVQYHLSDHLGSSNVVLSGDGSWVNREEQTSYGETSFGSFARKRYRYAGKESDEESGLHYHTARYYSPWVSRWINCDPAERVDGNNLYRFNQNNPIRFVDKSGTQSAESQASPNGQGINPIPVNQLPRDEEGNEVNLQPGQIFSAGPSGSGQSFRLYRNVGGFVNDIPEGGGVFIYDPSSSRSWDEAQAASRLRNTVSGLVNGTVAALRGNDANPGGSPSGGSSSSEGENPEGSPTGIAGSAGADPEGGVDATEMDAAIALAGILEFSPGSEDGSSGGVPGGGSPEASGSPAMQALYLAYSSVAMVLTGFTKGGLRRTKFQGFWRRVFGPAAMRNHHLIPRALLRRNKIFRRRMNQLVRNPRRYIDQRIARISNREHIDIHRAGWNDDWEAWVEANPNFTLSELNAFIKEMMRNYNVPRNSRNWVRSYGRR
ncbi:toxin TcdB middle/N-terminal domain-containing protein [Haloferax sp. DFSO52]|uniref:toxin TcdB middle/N-terminal domain-containing protein n=1 Tax=Haloferax sp. DFSO52 TaxID=3388505 RepID=UPI003A836048